MLRKPLPALFLCFALLLSLACCSRPGEEADPRPEMPEIPLLDPDAVPEPEPDPGPEPEPEPEPAGPLNPLTGLADGIDEQTAARIPVAVMVSNSYNSLPQWGISQADILIEMIAEGRITRFMALFQNPAGLEALGSVRSARPYFIDMAQGFEAAYLHFGGSVPAYNLIGKRKDLIDLDGIRGGYEGSLYVRDPSRRKSIGLEHSVVTSGPRIEEALAGLNRDLTRKNQQPIFQFDPDHSASEGAFANKVTLTFSNRHKPWFEYDGQSGQYLRYQYGQPQMDAYYDKQVAAANLIILRMPLTDVPGSELALVEVASTGQGQGFYCAGGRWIPITWERESYDQPLRLLDEAGQPLKLAPGKSFISCVATGADVIIE